MRKKCKDHHVTGVYLAAFGVGGVAVLTALLLTDVEVGGGSGPDGLPFLSLTSLAAGLLGAGTGGLISTWSGVGSLGAAIVAVVSGVVLIAALQGLGDQTDTDAAIDYLLSDPTVERCLAWVRLDLQQCVAAGHYKYEDSFCIAEHALLDVSRCLATESAGQ